MDRFLEDDEEYRSLNWKEDLHALEPSEIEVEVVPSEIGEEGGEPNHTESTTYPIDDAIEVVDKYEGEEEEEDVSSLTLLPKKEVASLRLNVNLALLETVEAADLYGFSYPDIIQSNYTEEQIAFSFTDLAEFDAIRARFYPIKHQFVTAASEAFDKHLGFALSPSQIYLLLLQQISIHQYSLRRRKSGQNQSREEEAEDGARTQDFGIKNRDYQSIEIEYHLPPEDDDFHQIIDTIRNSMREQFSSHYQYSENDEGERDRATGGGEDRAQLFSLQQFSNATDDEVFAGECCFFNQYEDFFQYEYAASRCGIPFFLLDGSVEDWDLLRQQAEEVIRKETLSEFSEKWLPILLPILDRLLRIRKRDVSDLSLADVQFFKNFVKVGEVAGSGAYTFINGWINIFFPLTSHSKWNEYCVSYDQYLLTVVPKPLEAYDREDEEDDNGKGMDVRSYPMGLSTVPINWKYTPQNEEGQSEGEVGKEEKIRLNLYSGFIGIKEEEALLRPMVGWWISLLKETDTRNHDLKNQLKDMEKEFGSIFDR